MTGGKAATLDGRINCPLDPGAARGTCLIGSFVAGLRKRRLPRIDHLKKIMILLDRPHGHTGSDLRCELHDDNIVPQAGRDSG